MKGYYLGALLGALAATTSLGAAPAAALSTEVVARTIRSAAAAEPDLETFYRSRNFRPIWVEAGQLRPEARRVIDLVGRARDDGLNPASFDLAGLTRAVQSAQSGAEEDLARAEILLSRAFTAYVRGLRQPTDIGMVYVDGDLAPSPANTRAVLNTFTAAPSLSAGIDAVTRMNPLYLRMRDAFAEARQNGNLTPEQERQLRVNLERARALPADLGRRFILVDANSARLWMYENGRVQDTMRVVVGKESEQTPIMAGYIRHITVNPFWNVPPDLVQRRIAPAVLSRGLNYLSGAGYEVLSDWTENAQVVDPASIDWQAVAAGRTELRVRQLPGPTNAMGNMKFMFPNDRGVYLHDTPNRDLFEADDRRQSSGCVRVEDAGRLARWLFQRAPQAASNAPEQNIQLPEPVPVYITYLTAAPEGTTVAFREDVYGRDRALMTRLAGGTFATAR